MIRKLSGIVPNPERDGIYSLLRQWDATFCIDVGAGAGDTAQMMSSAMPEDGRIIAFEPFPGNWPYLESAAKELPQAVEVRKSAVSDRVGRSAFHVPSVVSGTEKSWAERVGYSSVGHLRAPRMFERVWRVFRGKPSDDENQISVPTTTIDQETGDERRIDFMKIDVQGAEHLVLKGASRALSAGLIDVLYVEWSGARNVVDLLDRYAFEVLDSTYIMGGDQISSDELDEYGFQVVSEVELSTGKVAMELVLHESDKSIHEVMSAFNANGNWLQTDLIAVRKEIASARFEDISGSYPRSQT